MRFQRPELWIALSVVLAGLSACVSTETAPESTADLERGYAFPTVEKLFERTLAGHTLFFISDGHGTQVEYFAQNGRAYLWYRGNRSAVPSNWKTASPATGDSPGPPIPIARGDVAICFKYPSRSYNPVTKAFGGEWECRSSGVFGENVVAIVEGDPFRLETGRIPAVMPKDKTLSLEDVLALTSTTETLTFIYKRRQNVRAKTQKRLHQPLRLQPTAHF